MRVFDDRGRVHVVDSVTPVGNECNWWTAGSQRRQPAGPRSFLASGGPSGNHELSVIHGRGCGQGTLHVVHGELGFTESESRQNGRTFRRGEGLQRAGTVSGVCSRAAANGVTRGTYERG
jgi:hypothetical protein